MLFALFLLGLAALIGGIAWVLVTAGIAAAYVAIVCLVLAGIAVMTALSYLALADLPSVER